ncbi:MAG TPA: hypothetical protein VFR32_05730 [Gaiellaceae bacterium]|nr:hypothetical protein [Gaiellaceae bacterium]
MFKGLAVALMGASLAVVLAGCGRSEGFISTPTALAAFHQAGFTNLRVMSNRKAYEQLARRQGRRHPRTWAAEHAADQDTIATVTAQGVPVLFAPLIAVRLASAKRTKTIFDRSYTQDALTAQRDEARREYPEVLPSGFDLAQLTVERVCNVLIVSYNAKDDESLDARFQHAVALLRKKC